MKLSHILSKKNIIIDKAKQLGFENVRVYKVKNTEDYLHLLVSANDKLPHSSENNDEFLSAVLMNELECVVVVSVESKLKILHKDNVMSNSIPLNASIHEFEKLFQVENVENVKLVDFDKQDRKNQATSNRILRLAEKVMEKIASYSNYNPGLFSAASAVSSETTIEAISEAEESLRKQYANLSKLEQEVRLRGFIQSLGLGLELAPNTPQGNLPPRAQYGLAK